MVSCINLQDETTARTSRRTELVLRLAAGLCIDHVALFHDTLQGRTVPLRVLAVRVYDIDPSHCCGDSSETAVSKSYGMGISIYKHTIAYFSNKTQGVSNTDLFSLWQSLMQS